MSQQNIYSAFRQTLNAAALGYPIAWENASFVPTAGETYLEATLLPGEVVMPEMTGTLRREIGIFQVTVCIPVGGGTGAAEAVAEQIIALFPRGTSLTYNGISATIEKAWRSVGAPVGAWYRLPVSVRYWSNVIS